MRYVFVNLIAVLLCFYVWLTHSHPQSFEDATKYFKHIEFDTLHRGNFNITQCIKELINCWEYIKVDVVCLGDKILDSVCAIMYLECDEARGFLSWPFAHIFAGIC